MADALVTAIITTHNRPDLCEIAIASAVSQTYRPLEVIVVDDASSPECRAELESFIGDKLTYIYIDKEHSRGGNYARNTGIKNANGEYIALLDDDDEWLPQKIEKQMEVVINNSEVMAVSCGHVTEFNFKRRFEQDVNKLPEGDMHQRIFYDWVSLLTSSMLFNRQALFEVGLFDENLRFWQDCDLNTRVLQNWPLYTVKERLFIYRVINKDKSRLSNNIEGWKDAVKYCNNKFAEQLEALPPEMRRMRELTILKDAANRANQSGNSKLKRDYLKKIYRMEKTPKNLFKWLLNIISVEDMKQKYPAAKIIRC